MMSRILFINTVCTGSTGKICRDIYDLATHEEHECCIAYGRGEVSKGYQTIKIGNKIDVYNHVLLTRLFDKHGFGSKKSTKKFLEKVDEYNPDIIHLHNIHGYYINIELLFNYLKTNSHIKVIWTLHDCWAFTGHCTYFTFSKCNKWKESCINCPSLNEYPHSFFSNVGMNYAKKKSVFQGVKNLTIVTPSIWLKELVQQSFLNCYKCEVINNGIDINLFKKLPVKKTSQNVKILGVANVWNRRKGLESFIKLSTIVDNKYEITVVGLSKAQIEKLPKNIKGISRTNNIEELIRLYNTSDVFFNPTLEENYPTVNLEAQACGTPVVTYNTGGCKETLFSTSILVNNTDEFIEILDKIKFMKENFEINLEKIDSQFLFKKYIKLYEEK